MTKDKKYLELLDALTDALGRSEDQSLEEVKKDIESEGIDLDASLERLMDTVQQSSEATRKKAARSKYSPGDEVQSISDPGRIGTVVQVCEVHAGVQWYRVNFGAAGRPKVAEDDLRPYVAAASPEENLALGSLGGYREFQRLITQQRLLRDYPLRNNIYAFNASRTRFYPYQFKPLLKFLDSPSHRLLLADEVGLGKTIEAGLILTELRARQEVRRVLVICPANIAGKWRLELKNRFGEDFSVLNAAQFLEFLDEYEEFPERASINGIISLEAIRTNRMLNRLDAMAPDFDLVIVDEAHHMRNFGTKQRMAGVVMARTAKAMLLLTATPIHLGNENLFSLFNILDDEEFPDIYTVDMRLRSNEPIVKAQICMGQNPPKVEDALELVSSVSDSRWISDNPLLPEVLRRLETLKATEQNKSEHRGLTLEIQRDLAELNLIGHVFTRTRKKEVHEDVAVRRALPIPVSLTPIESQFYNAVTDYVRELSQIRTDSPLIQKWMLNTPQRRMASCIPAMVQYYTSKMGFDIDDRSEDDYLDEYIDKFSDLGFKFIEHARNELRRVIGLWSEDGYDSKYLEFIKIIRKVRKEGPCKVMVFAFFKDTLYYLQNRLSKDGIPCSLITGDTKIEERTNVIEKFRDDPNIEVLLSSRVGSEGLDFQFCDTMFNYDLPWNPMEVEQRIGRLDRIGQQSPVIRIFNFWVEGTIEKRILQRLYERIRIFERSIGELEMILGEEVRHLERDLLSRKLTPEEEEERILNATKAVEARLVELERLEGEAAQFIGTDLYFDEEIAMIRERRRYVTGVQLRRFVTDFIEQTCPRTRLKYDTKEERGVLQPDNQFRSFLTGYGAATELSYFLGAGTRGIAVTFDSQVAFEDPKIEFINVLHPLTQAIAQHYVEGDGLPSNAHHVILSTKHLPSGLYVYFIYKLKISAAKSRNILEMVLLNEDLKPACSSDEAEIILGEMVERGEDPRGISLEVESNYVWGACAKARDLLLERISQIKEEVGRNNDAFIERRLASLRIFYEKNLTRQRDLLVRGETERRQERYLRMLRGTINRLQGELDGAEKSLEKQRVVRVEYDDVAAGILEVVE